MSTSGGPYVFDGVDAKDQLKEDQYVALRDRTTGKILIPKMWCDVSTDNDRGWFLVFTAFPRIRSPYVTSAYGNIPTVNDTDMNKLSDDGIRTVLKSGARQTRAQWYQTSVEFGSVWATGNLNDRSTQYNEFENPDNWNSGGSSSGQRFKRRLGGASWTDWITSAGGGCSGAVGGWSNYYEQSCVQSWFAGCEGGPAINHRCAGGIQDRAEKILIWAA